MTTIALPLWVTPCLALVASLPLVGGAPGDADSRANTSVREAEPYCSPHTLAYSPDGARLAATDPTGGRLWLISIGSGESRPVALEGAPEGVVWGADGHLFVAETGAASVAEVDATSGRVLRRMPVGPRPHGLALAPRRGWLLAANSATHSVSVLDLATGAERIRVPVRREPEMIAVSSDESRAMVGNLLPTGRADQPGHGAAVSLLDLEHLDKPRHVRLPSGSSSLRGVAVSPDGRFGYVVHILGRTNVPTTQLERGWVNTNALTIVDLEGAQVYATVLLDHPLEGAADPWGVALSPDGASLWITLAGVHQLAHVDLARLHSYLEGGLPEDHPLARTGSYSPGTESVWLRIRRDPTLRAELVNDLAALHAADLIERVELEGALGPRGLALAPDGRTLAVASHFTGEVLTASSENGVLTSRLVLGERSAPDPVRRGRQLFHDATLCFQHWLSCATCHPGEARVDGMNWDNLNDGIGNPKNLKSLLHAHETAPLLWRGLRPDLDTSLERGFRFMLRQPQPDEIAAVRAYLCSLEPVPSPFLEQDGSLSAAAERGRVLFESDGTGCAACHPGPLLTDRKLHNVGTRSELDHEDSFDTPSLVEIYRTAPYLHDGSAATLRDVLITRNGDDRHGITSELDAAQLDDLISYLRSL